MDGCSTGLLFLTNRILPLTALLLAAVIFTTPGSGRAAEPSLFHWQKSVEAGIDRAVKIPTAVILDAEVYESSRADLADLRLVDQDGVEQPAVIETAHILRPGTIRTAQLASQRESREEPGNLLVYRFELIGQDPAADGISLITPLHDFYRTVTVNGSPDGKIWTRLSENSLIFDSRRYPNFSLTEIPLPRGNGCRQFEIRIAIPDDRLAATLADFVRSEAPPGADAAGIDRATSRIRPFRIDRIEFWQETATAATPVVKTAISPPESWGATQDAMLHATVVEFTTRGEPLTAVTLLTPARNFIRLARLDTWTDIGKNSGAWTEAACGTLSNLQTANADVGCQTLRLPGPVAARRWRLIIENLDSAPIPVSGLAPENPLRQLIFLADAGRQYRLLFGAPSLNTPTQDDALAASLTRFRQTTGFRLCTANVGTRQYNPEFGGQNRKITATPNTFNRKLALTAGVGLLFLILAWGLFKSAGGQDLPRNRT